MVWSGYGGAKSVLQIIAVSTKGCIHCNIVGKNTHSREFVMKYVLEMFIEGGISTIRSGWTWIRSVCWEVALTWNKTKLRIWGVWVERWFGLEM